MIIRSSNVSVRRVRLIGDCNAIVLAGGDGARLRAVTTTPDGEVIPKQYCSLGPQPCLLQQAVARARVVAGDRNVWPVVASHHERWWKEALSDVSRDHVIVQPLNRGTAFGILLGLLTLEREGAGKTVLILPADHHVADERVLSKALRRLSQWSQRDPDSIFLLGAQPENPDPALGYILPWFDASFRPIGVYEFIERPPENEARKLINRGALWNTFIVAGSRQVLLRTYQSRFAPQIQALRQAIDVRGDPQQRLEHEYQGLSSVDFSHDILERHADKVKVLRLPVCGWSELGTVSRIKKALSNHDGAASSKSIFFDLRAIRHKLDSHLDH